MDIKGSKTEENLMTAFSEESQSRNRFTYYASKARKDGYIDLANVFEETANNEKQHAQILFKLLNNGSVPDTIENLSAAADDHGYRYNDMYSRFAGQARDEGFDNIALLFERMCDIENEHARRYKMMMTDSDDDAGSEISSSDIVFRCSRCGYIVEDDKPPEKCPVCSKENAYYQIRPEIYK